MQSDWKEENDQLIRNFEFNDFKEAWGFMAQVALLAEKANHHPTWSNTYNQVEIRLSTHDANNTVTDKDRELAKKISGIVD